MKAQGEIYIQFPSQFLNLPNLFSCFITGNLNTFDTCRKENNLFIIKLDEDYNSGLITIKITNIRNPVIEKTDAFVIYSKYDSKIVDEAKPDSVDQRVISYTN